MTLMTYNRPLSGVLLLAGFSVWLVSAQTATPTSAPPELTIRGDIPETLVLKTAELPKCRAKLWRSPTRTAPISYEGVPLREILKRAGVPPGKHCAARRWRVIFLPRRMTAIRWSLPSGNWRRFGNEQSRGRKRDGKPLFGYQGPLRLVCLTIKPGRVPFACWKPSNLSGLKKLVMRCRPPVAFCLCHRLRHTRTSPPGTTQKAFQNPRSC